MNAERGPSASYGSVLVLDSDKEQAREMARQLTRQNWNSVLCFNEVMAIRSLKHNRFQLFVMDGYVDGVDMLKKVDAFKAQMQDTPLALMSFVWKGAGASQKVRDQALKAGADFMLPKPVDPSELKILLAETLKYHRARQADFHVLVVDPDVQLRTFIGMTLQQVGYKVSVANTMEDVLFDHNLGLVDAVVTAVLIPGMGGVEGIMQLRKDYPHIRTLAMSEGINDKIGAMHVLAAAKDAGAEELLPKPFVIPELLNAVARLAKHKIQAKNEAAKAVIDPTKVG
ncbi:response regulator [Asticcacaulis sp. AND118]|uniref:response regulator n=1 Tax=Asticcacaulis sp. AND118 TaxID=2840468 RepID=UPI001CFF5658|nr:response regulator [Asticcacaulis sp. AND118]UDF02195.1 response regulator [Asticcacaulis sp. AND118]